MKEMKDNNGWNEKDAVWDLLGKAAPQEASGRFADDTLRAVKILPEAEPFWPKILHFSPWLAAAACAALVASHFIGSPEQTSGSGSSVAKAITAEEQWVQIEEVAEAEMLAAAADHLDRFSDQELVTLIGF